MFFVISGYVITGLLVREEEQSIRHKLVKFYTRRIRRIMPAATLTLLVTLWMSYHWLGYFVGRTTGVDERWASVFAANWRFIQVKTSYFASQQPPSVILHFWSLAVEEQFYAVFPIVVFSIWAICTKQRRRLAFTGVLSAIVVASSAWCIFQTHVDPTSAYYSPFTRFWELALGAFVLNLPDAFRVRTAWARALLGWLGLAGIIGSALVLSGTTAYPGSVAWWPVGCAALLLWAGKEPSSRSPAVLLERRSVTFVGDISYSLYLWHYPVLMVPMQYAVLNPISVASRVELVGIAFGLAVISYFALENPIRRSRRLASSSRLSAAMAAAMVAAIWAVTALFQHFSAI